MPPWTFGCSVFTRPPSISGQPVSSATSRTLIPDSRKSRAVPPVETISTPSNTSSRANSTTPVLSYTLINARSTAKPEPPERKGLASVSVREKFRKGPGGKREATASVRDACFQLHAAGFDADRVFDFMAALIDEVFCFLAHKFFKVFQARRRSFITGLRAGINGFPVELLHLFILVIRIGERHRERAGRMSVLGRCARHIRGRFRHGHGMGSGRRHRLGRSLRLAARSLPRAFGLDGFCGGPEVGLGEGA